MRRLKTIDELYEEVKGYGLVLTNDVALETALNARIVEARIGQLAITPRHLVALFASKLLKEPMESDLKLMAGVSKATGRSMRHVYSEILNFREIRSHTANVEAYLGTKASRVIYEEYSKHPTLEKAMGLLDPEDEDVSRYFERTGPSGRIAVIGADLFDDLDKHCIPMDADIIEIFTDGGFEIPEIRVVGNDRQLGDNAASLIDPEHPTDFAIVISAQDRIADSVRSALYRRGLPFVNGMKVSDVPDVRDFIGFIALALDYPTLRIRQIKEAFYGFGGLIPPRIDNYLVSRLDDEDLKIRDKEGSSVLKGSERTMELRELMRRIHEEGVPYEDIKDALCDPHSRSQVTLVLDELGMLHRTADAETLSEIRFAVENVTDLTLNVQKPESERRGVLIADCKNSVYVDRPVVIYLGMEQEWNIPIVGRRYLDAEAESEKNAMRLEALLQQGQKRLYCINTMKDGKPVRPCLAFNTIFKNEGMGRCDDFSDICSDLVHGAWAPPEAEKDRRGLAGRHEEADFADLDDSQRADRYGSGPFSKTSFNCFAACPRRFMFNELVPGTDNDKSQFGNLIHNFAELYATHPEEVRGIGLEKIAGLIADRYAGISSPTLAGLDRDRILAAMTSIARYLDSLDAHPPLDRDIRTEAHPNPLMTALGIFMSSRWCEFDHVMKDHPLHGILDFQSGNVVTDYKTGRAYDAPEIFKKADWKNIGQSVEFQPLIYLAIARERYGLDAEFDLFYAMENDVSCMRKGYSVDENVRRVSLSAGSPLEIIASLPSTSPLLSDIKEELRGCVPGIARAIADSGIADPSAWKNDEALQKRTVAIMGRNDNKTARGDAKTLIGKIASMASSYAAVGPKGSSALTVSSEGLDRFLEHVDEMFEAKEECLRTGFPASPVGKTDCDKCDFFEICTRPRAGPVDGGDQDERSERAAGRHGGDPRGHARSRRGARHGEDQDHRGQVRQHSIARGRRAV